MKKTITITIGNTIFYVEEDAYDVLSDYLDSIKSHFANRSDGEEIITDIESRIAEHFLKGKGQKERIVTIADVETLISSMGKPEEFADENNSEPASQASKSGAPHKKLYRDTTDMMAGGVASGIAAYFGIEPIIVRIAFVLFTLSWGFGIAIYILLWILIPEAKTASEKLQMKGDPITLKSIDKAMKQTAEKIKNETWWKRSVRSTSKALSAAFGVIFKKVIPVFFKVVAIIVGVSILVSAILALLALTFAFAVLIFNLDSTLIDFPLRTMLSSGLLFTTLISAFVAAAVPVIFILILGLLFARMRMMQRGWLALVLLGLWFASLISLGVCATKIVPAYQYAVQNNPDFKEVAKSYADVKDFSRVNAIGHVTVEIQEGAEFAVEARGTEKELQSFTLESKDGVLTIDRAFVAKDGRICLFCFSKNVYFKITAPKYDSIKMDGGGRIEATLPAASMLDLNVESGSSAVIHLGASTKSLTAILKSGSWMRIEGATVLAAFDIESGSSLDAENLAAKTVSIVAKSGSSGRVNAKTKLEAEARSGSSILYWGTPELMVDKSEGSNVSRMMEY
ncbi:MAG: phage shock protein c, pspc [Parcubacteria group bacterium LiPW_15]|nr:MAG: phage shock protein c, pspc [Parcubacteria group bacterium LiPW_15]